MYCYEWWVGSLNCHIFVTLEVNIVDLETLWYFTIFVNKVMVFCDYTVTLLTYMYVE